MKKLYKMNLFGLLLAICLMSIVHGYAQNKANDLALDMISSEYEEKEISPPLNDRHSCRVIFELADSYGDGWNGNKLILSFSEGMPDVELTLDSGAQSTETLDIGNGVHVTLSWINGQYVYECSFIMKYENGEIIYTGSSLSAGVLYEFDCSCSTAMEDWNLLNSFTLTSGGQQGIVSDGNYIYSCSWQSQPSGGYSFYKYDLQGHFMEEFNITGVSQIRDLTYDGQYFYGSNGSSYLYAIDLPNKTLVSSVNTTCNIIRHCSYDPDNNGFWVGDWSNLKLINRNGQTIMTAPNPTSAYGSGYYKDSNNIAHLYLFCQPDTSALVYDYVITTNDMGTTPIFDFASLPGFNLTSGASGGAFISNYNGKTAFFGNVQQDPNLVGIYELGPATPGTDYATIILTAGDLWGDGTGYQMLLDADANTYGSVIPTGGGLTSSGDAAPEVYAQFEYKIPENADGSLTTQNIVINNSISVQIPAGVYDWCITNPVPGDRMWIAGSNGNIGGRQNDFTFEAGKTYEFVAKRFGNNDGVDLTVTGNTSSYVISASADPSIGGTVTGDGTYNQGESCTLTATPAMGYIFDHWIRNGTTIPGGSTITFTVTENATYVAHFQRQYTINVSAYPTNGGTVTGGGIYTQGASCTLTATPASGYTFDHWTRNDTTIDGGTTITFTVTEDATYVAHFNQSFNGYTISANANPAIGGSVTGAGIYAQSITITLTAMANYGYKFVNWTENGVIQCLTDYYEFVVDCDRTLVANFEELPKFTISAMAGTHGTISPQGDVQVIQGADQTFTMTPESGGRILKVQVDGIDIGPIETYTFTNANRDHTIFVSFSGMGVEEAQILNVNVYPNPAKDIVYIEGEGIKTVALFDILGNYLHSVDFSLDKELNLSGLPQGEYILMLTTQDDRIGYQKLLKVIN